MAWIWTFSKRSTLHQASLSFFLVWKQRWPSMKKNYVSTYVAKKEFDLSKIFFTHFTTFVGRKKLKTFYYQHVLNIFSFSEEWWPLYRKTTNRLIYSMLNPQDKLMMLIYHCLANPDQGYIQQFLVPTNESLDCKNTWHFFVDITLTLWNSRQGVLGEKYRDYY